MQSSPKTNGSPLLETDSIPIKKNKVTTNNTVEEIGKATAKLPPSHTAKNPIMLLNELRQGVEYKMLHESGDPHAKTFKFSVTVDGQTFEGTGKIYFQF